MTNTSVLSCFKWKCSSVLVWMLTGCWQINLAPKTMKKLQCKHAGLVLCISTVWTQVTAGRDVLKQESCQVKPLRYRNSGVCLARRLSWLQCLSPLSADRSLGANQIGFGQSERHRKCEMVSDWVSEEGKDILAQQRGEMPTRRRAYAEAGQ